ncbi:hypothetical protein HWV62_11630 [Athelia sp. TMB]|nr:hypothetical protein HWV62_11630 [Athelia sp. TMB]
MPSAIEFFAVSTALLYLLPRRYLARVNSATGLTRRILTFGPFFGEHNIELELILSSIPIRPPTLPRPTPVHPPPHAVQRRNRRNRRRNRRNNRRQRQEEVDSDIIVTPPAPPYQPRDTSAEQAAERFLNSLGPQLVNPLAQQLPHTVISDRGVPASSNPRRTHSSPYPFRVPPPKLPVLSPDHVDTRLGIRSGPPPPTSIFTPTAWVINRERQRIEKYFYQDRHLDGASPLQSVSFSEADESGIKEVTKANENYVKHIKYNKRELELVRLINNIRRNGIFNDQIHREYNLLFREITSLRLLIQETADSVRFLPNSLRFEFIPSYQTIQQQRAEEEESEDSNDSRVTSPTPSEDPDYSKNEVFYGKNKK